MRHVPIAIYIDTEVFVRNGLQFDTEDFVAIRKTFVKGGLRLLVPKMMELELFRHFERGANEVAEKLVGAHQVMERELFRHFKRDANKVAKNIVGAHQRSPIELPSLLPIQELESRCIDALQEKWRVFKEHFTVEELPLVGCLEDVVDWYFNVEPPFAKEKNKNKEFPDAFILSALEDYHRKHSCQVAIISNDHGFSEACTKRRYITCFKEISKYIAAFEPELTKTDDSNIIDLTKPITTEDLTEMKAILGRGPEATEIERNRVLTLLAARVSNYDYFFRYVSEAFWIDLLQESGFFSNPPGAERFEDEGVKMPIWRPMEYLVRVFEGAPDKVVAVLKSLPEDR